MAGSEDDRRVADAVEPAQAKVNSKSAPSRGHTHLPPGPGQPTLPPGAIGLRRRTTDGRSLPAKEKSQSGQARRLLDERRSEHQQRVWDKLDAARKAADERQARLKGFQGVEETPEEDELDDFDF